MTMADYVVSQLALYSQFNLMKPYQVSDDFETLESQLAGDGIHFSRLPLFAVLPNANFSSDQVLSLYASQIEEIKQEYNYLHADIASVQPSDPFSMAIRGRYLSEHKHREDEVRLFLDGEVLVYIHVNERIHILQCGKGDFIIIPKGIKHWMDIGPNPKFTSIRWFNSKAGLVNEFTGSYVAESTPRWETVHSESHFKR
jgi:1,2-dihydroxy-3-keto-5-methylthiopentene dioxygenase